MKSKAAARIIVRNIQKERKNKEDVIILGDGRVECPRITTQCCVLDKMLGGGMPLGRVVEIYGDEGSGKTTVALHMLASVQQNGGVAAMIDTEHGLDPGYAKAIGVDWGSLIFSQPRSGEEALEISENIMTTKSKLVGDDPLVIVVDSAAALPTVEELEGKIGDRRVAPLARLLSTSLRRLNSLIGDSNTIFIFTNQLREKVGAWGDPSKSAGGRALKFYSSVRIRLRVGKTLTKDKQPIGQSIRVWVPKNRTYPPFQSGEIRIIWGKGIDIAHSLFLVARDENIVVKKGSWYQFGRLRHQGEYAFVENLRGDPKLMSVIHNRVAKSSDRSVTES